MNKPVLVITTSFPRYADDDAGIFVARLVSAFSDAGLKGVVIVPKDLNDETLKQVGNFSIIRSHYGLFSKGKLAFGAGIIPNIKANPLLILQAPLLLISLLTAAIKQRKQISVISAHWMPSGLVALFIKLILGIPYTVTIRGEDFRLLKIPVLKLLLKYVLKEANAVITVSESLFAELSLITNLEKSKLHLIENGITVSKTIESSAPVPNPYLLFVGTVIPRKRIDIALRLLAEPVLSNLSLVICGRLDDASEVERLKILAEKLGIRSRFVLEGVKAPDKISSYLQHATAFLSASEFEGRPNALLEALALGKVVIASDIPAHREIIINNENGLLFSTNEDLSLVAIKLAQSLSDKELCKKISQAAQNSVSHLSWEAAAVKYKNLFVYNS